MFIYSRRVCQGIFEELAAVEVRPRQTRRGRSSASTSRGISLIAVVIIMLLVATLALLIASTISTGSRAAVIDIQEQQAFYLAEAGLEWYVEQLENDDDWSTPPAIRTNQSFGTGTFTVAYSDAAEDSIDVTVTGRVMGLDGNYAQRVIMQHIAKSGGGGTSAFSDFAIYYGGGDGTIVSNIAKEQTITGDIFVHGDLDIGKDCTITGNVSATGEIDVGSGTNISGSTNEGADLPAVQPTLDTAYYDDLILTASAQASGDRRFEAESVSATMYVNGDVDIDDYIDGSGTIVATGSISINKNTDIGDGITLIASGSLLMGKNGNVGTNVTFYSSSNIDLNQGIVLGAGAGVGEGVVLLSPGDIVLAKDITINGLIFGDNIDISNNLTLIGNLSGNTLTSLGRGAVIIKDNTKVDLGSVQGFYYGSEAEITTSLWQESL